MEIILFILIYVGFGYALYKVAKSKNREPVIWILVGLILSPIIVLIVFSIDSLTSKSLNQNRNIVILFIK